MRICPNCGAPSGAETCAYCGESLQQVAPTPAARLEAGGLACPRCEGEAKLLAMAVEGCQVAVCDACSGIWLERAQLETLTSSGTPGGGQSDGGGAPRPFERTVRYLRCPHCNELMARQNHLGVSGIIVDACSRHGLWLDPGELDALRRFVDGGGHERAKDARRDERHRTSEQRQRVRFLDGVRRVST